MDQSAFPRASRREDGIGARNKIPSRCSKRRDLHPLPSTSVVIFFAALFGVLTIPAFDPDFWWHLASGRWMWEHRALLRADPFDFTSAIFSPSTQIRYQLTQYWGAQVLLYGAYLLAGLKGVILLRAAVFSGLFFLLFRLLRRAGAGALFSVLLTALAVQAIVRELVYINDRPQLWSSFFFVVLLALLEQIGEGRRWARFAVPSLMLLWSNLHGGYILGVIVLAIAVAAAYLTRQGERRQLLLAAVTGTALAGCNPAGFEALISFPLALLAGSTVHEVNIYELEPLFRYVRIPMLPRVMPGLTATFLLPLLTVLPLLTHRRRWQWDLLSIYLLTLGMGLRSQRYLVFMVPMACWMTAFNIAALRVRRPRILRRLFPRPLPPRAVVALTVAALLALAAYYASVATQRSVLRPSATFRHEAESVADYLQRSGFLGNIFNDYALGGYLAWRLNPGAKVFIYGRMPYAGLLDLYNEILYNPGQAAALTASGQLRYFYQKVFDEYAVDAVVVPAGDTRSGDAILLTARLARDDAWALVHAEPAALVFLRKTPATARLTRNALPKTAVYDSLIAVALGVSRTSHGRSSLVWRRSIVLGYYGKGQKEEALRVFDEYGKLGPYGADDLELRESISREIGGAR